MFCSYHQIRPTVRFLKLSLAIHPYWQSLLEGSLCCILCPHNANVNFCWSTNTGMSMRRSPLENVAYVFVFTSTTAPSTSCSFYFDGLWDRSVAVQLVENSYQWDLTSYFLAISHHIPRYLYHIYILVIFLLYLAQSAGGCRIHRLHLYRGVRRPLTGILNMTLNNLMIRFQVCCSFGEYRIPHDCYRSQVHFGPKW